MPQISPEASLRAQGRWVFGAALVAAFAAWNQDAAHDSKLLVLGGTWSVMAAWVLNNGRLTQDERYHDFADKREAQGILNALNVVSNLPFATVQTATATWHSRGATRGPHGLSGSSTSLRHY